MKKRAERPGKLILNPQYLSGIRQVSQLLSDIQSMPGYYFNEVGEKTGGKASGCIIENPSTQRRYMAKFGYARIPEHISSQLSSIPRSQRAIRNSTTTDALRVVIDRKDLVNEYLSGTFYKVLLGPCTPKIGLISLSPSSSAHLLRSYEPPSPTLSELRQDSNVIALRSELIENFHTLRQLFIQKTSLSEVVGFDKVIASCLLLGDLDFHMHNVGYTAEQDESGAPIIRAVKVDHGKALMSFYQDSNSVLRNLYIHLNKFGYLDSKIALDPAKLATHLHRMTSTLTDQLIENSITFKIANLERMGMDISTLDRSIFATEKETASSIASALTNNLKRQRDVLKNTAQRLEIISKLSVSNSNFFNCEWIKRIQDQDPIAYAIAHNINIDGINPLMYALNNKINIDGMNPFSWFLKSASGGELESTVLRCIQGNAEEFLNSYPIALNYYHQKGIRISGICAIQYAIEHNMNIDGSTALQHAAIKNYKIDGINPVVYAFRIGKFQELNACKEYSSSIFLNLLSAYEECKDTDNQHGRHEIESIYDRLKEILETETTPHYSQTSFKQILDKHSEFCIARIAMQSISNRGNYLVSRLPQIIPYFGIEEAYKIKKVREVILGMENQPARTIREIGSTLKNGSLHTLGLGLKGSNLKSALSNFTCFTELIEEEKKSEPEKTSSHR